MPAVLTIATGNGSSELILAGVLFLLQGHRPTGKLVRRLAIGRINQESERFQRVGFGDGIDPHQTEPTSFLVSLFVAVFLCADLRVADCIDVDLVAKTIQVFTGVR